MKFKKGQSGNPNGRPKGSRNKSTKNLRTMIHDFLSENWEIVKDAFQELEAKEKCAFYEKLLRYGIPQLQSVSHTTDMEKELDRLTNDELEALMNKLLEHYNLEV